MCKLVAYYRVSTARQGRSGLGLEAQRAVVQSYVDKGHHLVAEFTEVESGKRSDRPELAKAMNHARLTGAKLVIAKLDRLSRNAAFLLTLRDSGVDFICADMPEADPMTIGVLALVAQREREMISQRTKAALTAAKARGTKLGNLETLEAGAGQSAATEAAKAKATERRAMLRHAVEAALTECGGNLSHAARHLTANHIETPRGKSKWSPKQIRRLMDA
jgi:DNA invertase Pin-like site-specific DNA recombinase